MTPAELQRRQALDRANEIRYAQTDVMRTLRDKDPRTAAILAARHLHAPDETVGGIRVERFLRSIPRYSHARVRKLFVEAGLPQGRLTRRIRELTQRERDMLGAILVRRVKARKPREAVAA